MARRGIFRRIVDAVFGRTPPAPRDIRPAPRAPTPTVRTLRTRAIENVVASLPLANRGHVVKYFGYLDDDELRWTATATPEQLRWRARQDADRLMRTDDGSNLPLNPWWYH